MIFQAYINTVEASIGATVKQPTEKKMRQKTGPNLEKFNKMIEKVHFKIYRLNNEYIFDLIKIFGHLL